MATISQDDKDDHVPRLDNIVFDKIADMFNDLRTQHRLVSSHRVSVVVATKILSEGVALFC